MRLIDADELDRAFSEARWYSNGELHHWGDRPNWCLAGEEVERLITDAPTIDAVPVVRCGECKHWHEGEWYNTCDKHIGHGFEDDYFCKYGERRTDETD